MKYEYKGFTIEIIDLIEVGLYDKKLPQDCFKYNIYYEDTCCSTGTRMLEYHCKIAVEYWVKEYGNFWTAPWEE